MSDKCVHTEHCCKKHGCKYIDPECPVVLSLKNQSFPCEECSLEDQDPIQYTASFNAALDFALDGEAEEEGLTFLRMWREGDWVGIAKEFPKFELVQPGLKI
jgi:hypothetical protein